MADGDGLMTASCEVSITRPQMLFGLPRKLSALLIFLCLVSLVFVDDWKMWIANVAVTAMVWAAVREQVSRDLWGFDNFCAWMMTDFWFFDVGGSDGWGGPRLCALPLSRKEADRAAR